jgi:hypothetical protein
MRTIGAALFGLAMCVAATGCNMILGNDVHELARDGQDAAGGQGGAGPGGNAGSSGNAAGQGGSTAGQAGASGVGGTGGAGGTGGTGGAAGGGGTGGASGAAGRGGLAGQDGGAGAGGVVDRDASINRDGSGGSITRDSSLPPVDADGGTVGPDGAIQDANHDAADACVPNSTECQWIEILQCAAACVTGACTGSCVPGTQQCMGNTPQTCDGSGQWQTGTTCPFVCTQGACSGSCVPGNTIACGDPATCNAGALQTCDTTGTLGPCLPAPSSCKTVPAGWEPVALVQGMGVCPAGFDMSWPQTYYTSATGAPYTCTCGCTGSQTCGGSVVLNEYPDLAGCPVMPSLTQWLPISSTCQSGGFGYISAGKAYHLNSVAYEPSPQCYANPHPTNQPPPPVVTQTVTLCTPNLACPSGACLGTDQTPSLCVYKFGINACPSGYPNATVAASYYEDTRSCGSCTCGSTLGCTFSGLVLNNDANCGIGHPYMMTATTTCSTAPSNYPLNALQATGTSTGDGTCAETSASAPMGSVSLPAGATYTICCQ